MKGNEIMKVNIIVDIGLSEPEIEIRTPEITDEVNAIAEKLRTSNSNKLSVSITGDYRANIDVNDIYRVYSANGKVYITDNETEYTSKQRLYEIEEFLESENFVRISNSEIINLNKVKGFDLSFPKTIGITMLNDQIAYVSRRYVSVVKPYLFPRDKAEDFPIIITEIGPFINVAIFDEVLIEDFIELGFSKYESDISLWKENQYSKRLEDFSPEVIEKWLSYFVSLGAVFLNGRGDYLKDLLYASADKGIIKAKEVFMLAFQSNGKYAISREKISKRLCNTCKSVRTSSTNSNREIFKEQQKYIDELLQSGAFEEVFKAGNDIIGGGEYLRLIKCKSCAKRFKLDVDMDRGHGGFWEEK